jgi:YidC/Oxa1 family membrane protein insertase
MGYDSCAAQVMQMKYLYHLIFYQPLLNALVFLYQTVAFRDLGIAIVLLTVIIRLILFPVFQKSIYHQMVMQKVQPKIKKLQEEYKGNYEKQSQAIMEVYRDHKINPFSGFFLLLIQLPILIALYQIFLNVSRSDILGYLYPFIPHPYEINSGFLGLINLTKPNMVIVGLAAVAQYFQGRLATQNSATETASAARVGEKMVWIAPLITLAVLWHLPAAVGLYWLVTSIFSVGQQQVINKKLRRDFPP